MKSSISLVLITLTLILMAAVTTVWLYPISFTPMIAIALFSGSVIRDKKFALVVPLAALFLTDVLFESFHIAAGFYGWAQLADYATLIIITLISSFMIRRSVMNIVSFAVINCVVFYLLSNTANFLISNSVYHTYPQTFAGYLENMLQGIPFMRMQLVSTACYVTLFFGVYAMAEKHYLVKQPA